MAQGIHSDFTPGFTIDLVYTDLRLALEMAISSQVKKILNSWI